MNKQELVTTFVERLERERTIAGLTQTQMAKELEMSLSGYKKMISGETSKIDLYTAYRLCRFTGKCISEFYEDEFSQLNYVTQKLYHLTEPQLCFIAGVVDFEIDFLTDTPQETSLDYIDLITPTGNMRDGMIWDSARIEKINVSYYRKRFGPSLHCALCVTSNNLHPVYNIGDILLISKTAPRDGDTVLLINKENGRAYIRKLKQTNPWVLEPINNFGVSFMVDNHNNKEMDKWIIYGHVLTKMRKV